MPYRILVVDDESDQFTLFREIFRKEIKTGELQFHYSANGKEALEAIVSNGPFQILFTDIRMGVMDGITLLKKIKELNFEMKVIVISAFDEIELIREAMNLDAFDFLVKPIDRFDLQKTLQKAIREYESFMNGIEARKQLILAVKEKEAAILKERLRISRDLHDDIGATLSGISICASYSLQKLNEGQSDEVHDLLIRIIADASEMVINMSEMVWLINPNNDSLEKLIDRIQSYASNILTIKGVRFIPQKSMNFSSFPLSIEKRKNIYLIIKESINNSSKYAECSEVRLEVDFQNSVLHFRITDDGIGFLPDKVTEGNGLKNIRQRAAELGGQLEIHSEEGSGTLIQLLIPLPQMVGDN